MKWTEEDLPREGAGRDELERFYGYSLTDVIDKDIQTITRWAFAHELLDLREQFKKDPAAPNLIPRGLFSCARADFAMPRWLGDAYVKAWRSVHAQHAKDSWEAVFGKPYPKGSQREARRSKARYQAAIYLYIRSLKATHPETPIDPWLFEQVGRHFGVGSSTTVSNWYYEYKRNREADLNR